MSEPDHGDPLDSDESLHPSRRLFVQTLTFMGGGVILMGCTEDAKKAPDSGPKKLKKPSAPFAPTELPAERGAHKTFTNAEWGVVVAAVDRILPKDQDPGAVEADVPEYIDRILQSKELTRMREDFVGGIGAIDRRAAKRFGTDPSVPFGFANCTDAQKDELLAEFKDYEGEKGDAKWYEILLVLTMEGFLGDPSYGGNKDGVGWKLTGYDFVPKTAAPPPKGYDGANNLAEHHCHPPKKGS